MSFCQNLWIEIIKSIPFLIIGSITAYIAYRQYKIEKARLKTELYTKRYIVFEKINKLYWSFLLKSSMEGGEFIQYTGDVLHRHFVFSEELNSKFISLESVFSEYVLETSKPKRKKISNDIIDKTREIMDEIVTESKIT